MLRDKAGQIISRIFMLRAQVIILIALIKIVKTGLQFAHQKHRMFLVGRQKKKKETAVGE